MRKGAFVNNDKCLKCENPWLKGVRTCGIGNNPYARPGGKLDGLSNLSDPKLNLLQGLLELPTIERDRVLRALGL